MGKQQQAAGFGPGAPFADHRKVTAELDSMVEKQILWERDENWFFFSRYLEKWREFSSYLYTDYCFEEDRDGDTLVLGTCCRNSNIKPGHICVEQGWFILAVVF